MSHKTAGINRRTFLSTMGLTVLSAPLATHAQQAKRYHIGVLSPSNAPANARNPIADSLEKRFSDLGWVNGKDVMFTYRYSGVNDALPALAKELVMERVDIIITTGTPASLAARDATVTIPVVFY